MILKVSKNFLLFRPKKFLHRLDHNKTGPKRALKSILQAFRTRKRTGTLKYLNTMILIQAKTLYLEKVDLTNFKLHVPNMFITITLKTRSTISHTPHTYGGTCN